MKNTFINPEEIDILTHNYGTSSENTKRNSYPMYGEVYEEVKNQQSGWKKFSSMVKKAWENVKPIITGLTMFFTVTGAFLKSVTKFGTQCKNMKEAFA